MENLRTTNSTQGIYLMKHVQKYIFGLFLFFLTITFAFHYIQQNRQKNLDPFIKKIEAGLHPQEFLLDAYFTNDPLLYQFVQHFDGSLENEVLIDPSVIEELSNQAFTIIIYKDKDPIYWSNDNVLPTNDEIESILQQKDKTFHKLENGYYEVLQKPFANTYGTYHIVGLIPIQYTYPIKSEFLQNQFLYVKNFPDYLTISDTLQQNQVVQSKDGHPLFSIQSIPYSKAINPQSQFIFFILLLLTALPLFYFINEIAIHFNLRFGFWAGFLFLGIAVFSVNAAIGTRPIRDLLDTIPYFKQLFSVEILHQSLGSFLLQSSFVFWLVLFFYQRYEQQKTYHYGSFRYILYSIFHYAIIIGGLLYLIYHIKKLVLETSLIFDFENILQFNVFSGLALMGTVLLILSLFLFTYKIIKIEINLQQKPAAKLLAFCLGLLINLPLLFVFDLHFPYYTLVFLIALFVFTFELFIEYQFKGFAWLVIWTLLFSGLGTSLIYKYNIEKDLENRIMFARQKIEVEDQTTLNQLFKLRLAINKNENLKSDFSQKDSFRTQKKEVLKVVDSLLATQTNLLDQFSYNFFAYNETNDSTPIIDQPIEEYFFVKENLSYYDTTKFRGVFYTQNKEGEFIYAIESLLKTDSSDAISCFLTLDRINETSSKVYSELLRYSPYNPVKIDSDYEFIVFQGNEEINSSGVVDDQLLQLAGSLKVNEYMDQVIDNVATLIYKFDNGKIAIVRKQLGGLIRIMSLFSYLFVLNIFFILMLNLIRRGKRIFPVTLGLEIIGNPSLSNRIQASIVLLNIGSFILIAIVTITFFRNSSIDYHYNRFLRKINTVLRDIQSDINLLDQTGKEDIDYTNLLATASEIHSIDINLFNLDGKLIKSSASIMQDLKILPPIMDARAYFSLKNNGTTKILQKQLGDLSYQEAFIPLKISEGSVFGYLSIPYYSKNRNLSKDVYNFMGTMLNVYVILFILAGTIAIFVANSITKPLEEVGEKIRRLRLGKNEPLKWSSKDELGKLIAAYNKMIYQLEESTEKLKVTEREGAWREMAKQIAHEIKNPLTPMKLNIQYLMRAYQGNTEEIGPKLKKISNTLIDQIDGLSRIASEFSNFAKMPKAENQSFEINQLLESIYNLFKTNPQNIDISLSLPEHDIIVYADKGHLMRVFNNLVKNAIQAIPEDRKGKILINLTHDQGEQRIIASVKDNGTGISKAMQEKVFYPNFTTKNSGMGLGLAISKNIIEAANGQIYFHTEENHGTTFFIELPIYEPELT